MQLDQRTSEALAWRFFRVLLPVKRERLRNEFLSACERLRPGRFPGNTKAGLMEMREFYQDLVKAPWTFVSEALRPRLPEERYKKAIRRMPQGNVRRAPRKA